MLYISVLNLLKIQPPKQNKLNTNMTCICVINLFFLFNNLFNILNYNYTKKCSSLYVLIYYYFILLCQIELNKCTLSNKFQYFNIFLSPSRVQYTKILMVTPKCEMIFSFLSQKYWTFLCCSPYSYHLSSKKCGSDSYRSLSLFKKSKG